MEEIMRMLSYIILAYFSLMCSVHADAPTERKSILSCVISAHKEAKTKKAVSGTIAGKLTGGKKKKTLTFLRKAKIQKVKADKQNRSAQVTISDGKNVRVVWVSFEKDSCKIRLACSERRCIHP